MESAFISTVSGSLLSLAQTPINSVLLVRDFYTFLVSLGILSVVSIWLIVSDDDNCVSIVD